MGKGYNTVCKSKPAEHTERPGEDFILLICMSVRMSVHVLVCVAHGLLGWAGWELKSTLRGKLVSKQQCIETQGSILTRGLRRIQTPDNLCHSLWESLTHKNGNHCLMGEQLEMPLNFKILFSTEFWFISVQFWLPADWVSSLAKG